MTGVQTCALPICSTLGMLVGQATGDEELGEMVKQGISDTGDELLSGKKLSLGSKILPIAKKSVNMVVDNIEDPQYRAVAKQIVKKSGAGLYGKAGSVDLLEKDYQVLD